jgi:hypothetical protein
MGMEKTKEARICDLPLPGYLCARDNLLFRTEEANEGKGHIFSGAPDSAMLEFYNGRATIGARRLLDAPEDLKGLLLEGL